MDGGGNERIKQTLTEKKSKLILKLYSVTGFQRCFAFICLMPSPVVFLVIPPFFVYATDI